MSNAVGDQAREGGKESHSRERWALPVLRFCCGRKLALGGLRRLSTKTCNFEGQKHGDRNIMRDLKVSSSRNFEKRPSHASDPVILISLIDSLLYHAKSLVNANRVCDRSLGWSKGFVANRNPYLPAPFPGDSGTPGLQQRRTAGCAARGPGEGRFGRYTS